MQLATEPKQLKLQLELLLSADPRVPLGNCIQPRAVCLPLSQQLALVLSISQVLHTDQACCQQQFVNHARPLEKPVKEKLEQLLHLLCTDNSNTSWGQTVQQTAELVIQQNQQALLHQFGQLHMQVQQAVMPTWMSAGSQHCFGWLAPSSHTPAASTKQSAGYAQTDAVQLKQQQQVQDAHASLDGLPTDAADVGQETGADLGQHISAAAADLANSEDSPPAKRAKPNKPEPAAYGPAGGAADAAGPADAAAAVAHLVEQQLMELDSSCDVSGLDLQLLEQALLATPPPGAPGSITADAGQSMFASLHLKLQELSIDALAALLDRALGNPSSSHAVTTAGTPAATDAAMATGLAVSQEALACLMANAVLPRLQQLSSAAPKALLSCLTCVAHQQLDTLTTVVLKPLLISSDLVAVQGQLLIKLMKDVLAVQERVLHLLLQAAGVQAGQTTVNPFSSSDILATNPIGALNSCCWTESHVVLLKAVLDTSPQLISAQLDAVVTAVRAAAQQQTLRKSTAFGQLLMALTNNYKAVVNLQQVEQLEAAAAATDTFLTRAVKSKLQQLKAQHAAANSR